MRGFGGSPDTAAHNAYLPSHTHKPWCLEQPGSKENNKYSEYTHAFSLFLSHTHTHTRRKISPGHCKPRRHRRLPLPPLHSSPLQRPRRSHFPLGVSLSFAPSPSCSTPTHPLSHSTHTHQLPSIHVTPPSIYLSSFPPSDPLLFSSDASWNRPTLFCMCGGGGVAPMGQRSR